MARPTPNRRQHFRLTYPPGAGPILASRGAHFLVVELSERGLRLAPPDRRPAPGERLGGVLSFADGVEVPVEGLTERSTDHLVTVRLSCGVGLDRMVAEQKRILRDYPDFLRNLRTSE